MKLIPRLILVALLFFLWGKGDRAHSAEKEQKSGVQKPARSGPVVSSVGVPQIPQIPNIAEIQQELQNIAQIHRSLQYQHYNQIQEIQRITEQARAHQQLLKNLSTSRTSATTTYGIDLEEVLRREKIRLIQEQAHQNRAVLEGLQKKAVEEEQTEGKKKVGKKKEEKKNPPPGEKPKKKSWWG
jgi:hypothetical protein